MCWDFNKRKLAAPTPGPEDTADPAKIGEARKAEDEDLFGGVPKLRVDRSTTESGVGATGSGLKVM